MAVEKIENLTGDAEIDPSMEIRTLTYTIAELTGGGPGCIISQNHAVRYFEEKNPELIVKQVYSFKQQPQDQTVALKIRVTKRNPAQTMNATVPITNPARLLNAGPEKPSDAVIEISDEFATLNDKIYFDTLGKLNARIAELEKENTILKSAIEKFGNSDEFDWNVLGRIDELETAVKYAITDLPESPDSAKAYLLHVLAPSKNPKEEDQGAGEQE